MYKKGFTLQELLVSLAIVGVVAALVLPGLNNMRPDKTKTIYMKAYNTLATQTAEILDDTSLYWDSDYDASGNATKVGLYSTALPEVEPYHSDANCGSNNKFAAILSHKLTIIDEPTYSNSSSTSTASFTTTNSINWIFETSKEETSGVVGNKIDVTININPSSKNNACVYSSNCTNPNQFKFRIFNDGGIVPADALGMAYLQNATNMHPQNEDADLAAKIISEAGSSTDIDKMTSALNTILGKKDKTEK